MRRLFVLFACLLLGSAVHAKFSPMPVNVRANAARTGVVDAAPIWFQPDVRWTYQFEGRPQSPLLIDGVWLLVTTQTGRQSGQIHLVQADTGDVMWTAELRGAPIGTPAYSDAQVYAGGSGGGLTAYSVVDGSQVWQNTATSRVWGSVLLAEGLLFATADNGIFAFNPVDGAQVWRTPMTGANMSPVFDGESVIVGAGEALIALDPADGAERWRVERPGAVWFAAAVLDGMLVGAGNEVVAYDLATREELWSARGDEPAFSAPVLLPDLVIAGNTDGHMRAFDRHTGALRWNVETPDWAVSDPVYSGGVLSFGIGNHIDETPAPRPFYALDAFTGEVLWTHEAAGHVTQSAAVGDNAIYYVDSAGQLVALAPSDAAATQYRGDANRTGILDGAAPQMRPDVLWQAALDSSAMPPVAADGVLYVPEISGTLRALDGETGDERWRYTHGEPMISPVAAAHGLVFFGAGKRSLIAADAATGETRWAVGLDDAVWSSAPLLVGDAVLVGSEAGTIYAIEQATGAVRWSYEMGAPVLWPLALGGDGRMVTAASWTDLVAVDVERGRLLWTAHTGDKWGAPASDSDAFYVGTGDNTVVALNAAIGRPRWTFTAPDTDFVEWSGAVVSDELVYIGHSGGVMYALDTDNGSIVWDTPVEDWATADPILADGLLIFGVGAHANQAPAGARRTVYALDAATGELRWTFPVDGLVHAGAALMDGTVYVVTVTGNLYALR